MHRILNLLFFLSVAFALQAQVYTDQTTVLPDDLMDAGDKVVTTIAQTTTAASASVVTEDSMSVISQDVTPECPDTTVIIETPVTNQEESDSIITSPAEHVEVPQYMLNAAFRSWRRSHPLQPGKLMNIDSLSTFMADSLHRLVDLAKIDPRSEMLYLYDMRLPLINSGNVPTDSTLTLSQQTQQFEEQADREDLPISHFDDVYVRQTRNEEQRHLARYNYASTDPRRFRFVRRKFDVPTVDSQTLDTKTSVTQTRVVDDINVDFSDASLEDFGQSIILRADKWHWKGDHSLTMQQTALSENWYKGGDNNMSVSGEQKITVSRYDEEKKTTFETVVDLKLSGYYTKADTIHRMKVSDNELSVNVKYGYRAWKQWYYSAQLYTKTPVFDYYSSNSRKCLSTFLSPLELNLSLGVDYQYTSTFDAFSFSLLLAPLSYDLKAISDSRVDETSYGLKEGNSTLHKFGSSITGKMEWKMNDNATWSSRLYYFTAYNSVKVELENTFNFKISRFFTAKIYAYPRFDDTRDRKTEVKEMLTFGFSYQW